MTRDRKYQAATQIIHRHDTGAILSAASAAACLVFSAVLIGLAIASDRIIAGRALSESFVTWWVRAIIGVALIPFVGTAWGKLAIIRSRLEGDLYRETGWKVDLDGDGRVGAQEVNEPVGGESAPARETVRLVRVNQYGLPTTTVPEPMISATCDGKLVELPEAVMVGFVKRAEVIGLGWAAWSRDGLPREQWDDAIALLAFFGCLLPKSQGRGASWLVEPTEALATLGIGATS